MKTLCQTLRIILNPRCVHKICREKYWLLVCRKFNEASSLKCLKILEYYKSYKIY
jgi:hypothetical protein